MKLPETTSDPLNEEAPASPIASASRALPRGSWLADFEVENVIGEGSAAIVYATTDRTSGEPVAIAEYMPARLAQRGDDGQVTPRSASHADTLAKGLKAFIDETRTLARCNHPSLVRIVRLWEGNATAYRAMPRYPSRRLLDVRQGMNEPPDEEALRALLDALLGALEAFHHAGGCHGKVTPSNILMLADNRPLLLGPGAAGRAITSDRIDALMSSVDPSFAPIEQIVEPDIQLHPSVDLYALAGVARYWMSGQLPAPASGTSRRETLANTVQRLRLTWPRLHYSASLLDALDSALSIYPAQRPQSVAQMRARLGTAPAATVGIIGAASTPEPTLNDAMASSPAPVLQPAPAARVSQDPVATTAIASDSATASVDGMNIDPSVPTPPVRQALYPKRIAMGTGAALVLLALLVVGINELGQKHQVARVLDVPGVSRDTGAGESASASTYTVSPASPGSPQIAEAPGAAKPIATESTAAGAASAKSMPSEPATAEVPASAIAPASPASDDRTTVTDANTAAPAAVAQPRVPSPPSLTPVAPKNASRTPANPRAACGTRTEFALYRCMQRECRQRQWASHPQCERLRIEDRVD